MPDSSSNMAKVPRIFCLLFNIITSSFFLLSCSGTIGYGVILWGNTNADETSMEGLNNGEIVLITGESKIKNSFIFEFNNAQGEINVNRVAFFRHRPNAIKYRDQFIQFRNWYAMNMNTNGLVMRASPSRNAEQVYRLRPHQTVKLLARASEHMTLGNIEGRWYEVLAEDGVHGFTFDYYLRIEEHADTNQNTEPKVIKLAAFEQSHNELQISLNNLQGTWYRKQHTQQLRSGQNIDLRMLMLPYGQLHLNSKNRSLDLYMAPRNSISQRIPFDPAQVVTNSATELYFPDSGTRAAFNRYDEISFYFHNNNGDETIIELLKITAEELQRYQKQAMVHRKTALKLLLEHGSQYSSAELYGSIRFQPDGQFYWSNTDALVEQGILQKTQNKGIVFFPYKIGLALQYDYSQLLTFVFADGQEASFLLKSGLDNHALLRYVSQFIFDKTDTLNNFETSRAIDIQIKIEGQPLLPEDLF